MPTRSHPRVNDMFTALAHPLRRQILRRMLEEKGELSPRQLAADLSQPLSALSYHVRVLAQCDAIELRGTKAVRGSTQHFYRAEIKLEWARLALATPERAPKRGRRRRPGEEKR
jgi:DNA-binding transcriptional ArsR family regulator